MYPYLLIFLGGGIGASMRFLLSSLLHEHSPLEKLPIGILACNILGCFAIGLVAGWQSEQSPSWLHPFLITGLLGGFTTFSTFGLETVKLLQSGSLGTALAYIAISVIGSLLALFVALKITS